MRNQRKSDKKAGTHNLHKRLEVSVLGIVLPVWSPAAEPLPLLACLPISRIVPALLETMKEGLPAPTKMDRQRLASAKSPVSDEYDRRQKSEMPGTSPGEGFPSLAGAPQFKVLIGVGSNGSRAGVPAPPWKGKHHTCFSLPWEGCYRDPRGTNNAGPQTEVVASPGLSSSHHCKSICTK